MTKRAVVLAIAAISWAHYALGDGITYQRLSFDRFNYQSSAGSFDANVLQAGLDYQAGALALTGRALVVQGNGSPPINIVTLGADYSIGPGYSLGVGLDRTTWPDVSSTVYEARAEYSSGGLGLGLAIDAQDGILPSTILYGRYAFGPNFTAGGILTRPNGADKIDYFLYSDVRRGNLTMTGNLYGSTNSAQLYLGLEGQYRFGDRLRASAGIGTWDFGPVQSNRVDLGGSYRVGQDVWLDATVSRWFGSGVANETTALRLGLTYELGSQGQLRAETRQRFLDLSFDGLMLDF